MEVAPVITKLYLVWHQLRLLGSNKTFETEVFAENMVDMPRRDIFEGEDLGLDLLGSDKGILLDQSFNLQLSIVSNLPVLCASTRILLTRDQMGNFTRKIRPGSGSLRVSEPVVECCLGDLQPLEPCKF